MMPEPLHQAPGRHARAIVTMLLLVPLASPAASGANFGHGNVVDKARRLAQSPYRAPNRAPTFLRDLSYDDYRAIRFEPEAALWPGHDFRVQFFPPGHLHEHVVAIHVVDDEGIHEIPFASTMFDLGPNAALRERIPEDLGFAGFRLHYTTDGSPRRANSEDDEFLVFLGASYFRLKGMRQEYGLSARGAAIDTGLPDPEEFPRFTTFWLERPRPEAKTVTVHALLDSPSLTGAYRFDIKPGKSGNRVDVAATLFLRRPVDKLGLAPLTSMFMYSVGDHRPPAYLRPAVHDSDGLLLHAENGEWVWRPLQNPARVTVDRFRADDPRGFGLLQRDRDYDHYQSPSMEYQKRPSLWVTPRGDWGPGHLELVQLPTGVEWQDNIVAYWRPAQQPSPGEPLRLGYRLRADADGPAQPLARVTTTRKARRWEGPDHTFVVEFAGAGLMDLPADAGLRPQVSTDRGRAQATAVSKDSAYGVWRVRLQAAGADGEPQHLRLHLERNDKPVTETWDYVVRP